jgi:enhanced entry protein EnhC
MRKTMLAWACGMAFTTNVCAITGLEAYYQGDFAQAAALLKDKTNLTAQEEYYMGRMYLYGYGVLKSNALANQAFKRAAEKGSLPAQLLLAKIELFQNNSPEQALLWFKKAAKANDVSAQMYCAGAYLYGVGTQKNADLARDYIIAAAKNNQPIAQQTLAADFLKNKQLATRKTGMIWLNKALEAHDPEAELMMADLYFKGDLVAKNPEQARLLIEEAVNQEYIPAFYQMGRFQQAQDDLREAKRYYFKAANSRYAPAQLALAEMYRKGEGVAANETLAARWEQKANQTNNQASTQQQMTEWLTHGKAIRLQDTDYQLPGIYSVWQDPNALQENIYNQAPKLNSISRKDIYQERFNMILPNDVPINQYYDAMMQMQNMKDDSNQKLSLPHYAVPKQNNEVQAEESVVTPPKSFQEARREGYDYLTQTGAENSENYSAVFKHLFDQAVLGDSTAQFDVALMYQQGIGVTQSIDEAIKFYQLAAAQNDLPSEYHLGLIYLQGMGVTPNYQIGMEWLNDAAFKGNYYAQYALARIYEQGYRDSNDHQVIAPDAEQALAMYQLSAANCYGPSQYHLAEILVRQTPTDMSAEGLQQRQRQIKRLFQGAVDFGMVEAKLPLAFYNASDADETKQAQAFLDAQEAANNNSPDAAFLLGLMYDRGIATQADHKRALYWYEQAITNPMSAFILGTYIAEGNGIRKDVEKAQDYLNFAANKRFAAASFNLAILQKRQNKPFLNDLAKAADSGLSRAGLTLADYYMAQEKNTPAQLQQARELYEKYAKQGINSAQLKLGYLYEQGLGTAKDYKQALAWYTAAAEQEHKQGPAQYLLGRLYQFGLIGSAPDNSMAKQWYAKVKAYYAPAAVAYGFIDEVEHDDYAHAFNEYQQAADLGDPIAQFDLALIYEKGKNQAVDIEKAKELFKQASQHKVVKAMISLSNIYILENSIGKALPLLKSALAFQDPDAFYQMGWLAEKGLIPQASMNEAIKYYQTAAAQGQANAILALARLYKTGSHVKQNLDLSATYYAKLAQENYPEAQYQLAKLCLISGTKNCTAKEAQNWLHKAEQNGYHNASQLLRLLTAKSHEQISYIESISMFREIYG